MRYRGAIIGLSLFMVVAVALTWLVYVTLRRDVAGRTVPYAAVFSDVFGLREGDDVRMAGVRVGRVESIELQGTLAKVAFVVEDDQQVLGTTVASVTYQNIVGQRYLGLSLGNLGEPGPLPPGSVIPVERTDPSFDVGTLLNGYEPLFSLLNPRDADNLTKGVVQSLQGDTGSITALVDQTSQLTESFAGRDEELGAVITDLNTVVENLANHNDDLDHVITETQTVVSTFDARRPELVASTGAIAKVVRQLSTISDEVYPSLNELVTREPGFASHMVGIEPQLAFTGANLPLLLKGFARITSDGAYANAYACDLNLQRLLPRAQRRGSDHRRRRLSRTGHPILTEVQEHGQWLTNHRGGGEYRLEDRNKTWLGVIAVAVVTVVIGAMLLIKVADVGYRHYTAQFLQAAALKVGNPITIAGIPVGEVTSMELAGDHVEAGLKVRDDIPLGAQSSASIKVTTILGSRYLSLQPAGEGSCPTTPSTWSTPRCPTICRRRCPTSPPPMSRSIRTSSPKRSVFSVSNCKRSPGHSAGIGQHPDTVGDHRPATRPARLAAENH